MNEAKKLSRAARAEADPLLRRELEATAARLVMLDRWKHKNEGTPETHDKASRQRQGTIARLFELGTIDADQLGWAAEIAAAAEEIERDVVIRPMTYEPRIDCAHSTDGLLIEGLHRVRRSVAYTHWRGRLPMPKRMVLDVLSIEQLSLTVSAERHNVHRRVVKRAVIRALNGWPASLEFAENRVDVSELAVLRALLS